MALAEALLLDREGAALKDREGGSVGSSAESAADSTPPIPANTSLPPVAAAGAEEEEAEAAAAAGPSCSEAPAAAAALNSSLWNDEKAAVNHRRLALLSKSLESNDVHNLQVLRRSLELQVKEEVRSQGGTTTTPALITRSRDSSYLSEQSYREEVTAAGPMGVARVSTREETGGGSDDGRQKQSAAGSSAEGDERWHAEVLDLRLAAVAKAVEKKGGWRSAVFLDSGEVNMDVDAGPWPPEEGVLILQTVRDALVVQLMEVSSICHRASLPCCRFGDVAVLLLCSAEKKCFTRDKSVAGEEGRVTSTPRTDRVYYFPRFSV